MELVLKLKVDMSLVLMKKEIHMFLA
jgi:hypothetical protein